MTSRKLGLALALALAVGNTLADPSPAKKALIDKIVALQQQGLPANMANSLIQGPVGQLAQSVRGALQQIPSDKREATAKAIEGDIKKFIDENVPYLRDKVAKALGPTSSALLDERFNEDELKQILAWAESPVSQKFTLSSNELQQVLVQKVMTEAGPTLDGRFKTLNVTIAKQLGLPPPPDASASKTAPAPKPAASAPKK